MAISNCLSSPTSENPREFSELDSFIKSLSLTYATTHSLDLCGIKKKKPN